MGLTFVVQQLVLVLSVLVMRHEHCFFQIKGQTLHSHAPFLLQSSHWKEFADPYLSVQPVVQLLVPSSFNKHLLYGHIFVKIYEELVSKQ